MSNLNSTENVQFVKRKTVFSFLIHPNHSDVH